GAPTTDPHDAIAADAERPAERRRASSVDDQRVRDDEVEHRRSAAGEEHAERGASAGTVFDPRASTVEFGEALHEGQTHPDPRGMPGRGAGGLAERFEDLLAELGRDPRSVVLEHEQQATVRRTGTPPHLGFRRRVPYGDSER